VVKLWAKLDTIEDRLSFNERKLEEKLRSISDLAAVIKENNVSRLEEKLKNMQTEIFTSLKEMRGKLETKLNQADYDKYCQHL
jgi:predicted transcriptional regulator